MNLETCIKWPVTSKQFRRVVLHEFGHALGFAHEHQHPNANCSSEIEWDKAYAFYEKTQHWDRKKVDANLRTITVTGGMILSPEGDVRSIMRYYLSPSILKKARTASASEPKHPICLMVIKRARSDFIQEVLDSAPAGCYQKAPRSSRRTTLSRCKPGKDRGVGGLLG